MWVGPAYEKPNKELLVRVKKSRCTTVAKMPKAPLNNLKFEAQILDYKGEQ